MKTEELHKQYFSVKTNGYKIINFFYRKYYDLFKNSIYPTFNDFLNEIFINTSKINFSKEIINEKAYILGSIKIQCRICLDKVIKLKSEEAESYLNYNKKEEDENIFSISSNEDAKILKPNEIYEGVELFNLINNFKLSLKQQDIFLLNLLIDEIPRKEIALKMNINLNTLDTKIRRLRTKLYEFIKKAGFEYQYANKFLKDKETD